MTGRSVCVTPALLERTPDGVPYSPQFGDIYHSVEGGLAQARHVFLAGNSLPERWRGRDAVHHPRDGLRARPEFPRRLGRPSRRTGGAGAPALRFRRAAPLRRRRPGRGPGALRGAAPARDRPSRRLAAAAGRIPPPAVRRRARAAHPPRRRCARTAAAARGERRRAFPGRLRPREEPGDVVARGDPRAGAARGAGRHPRHVDRGRRRARRARRSGLSRREARRLRPQARDARRRARGRACRTCPRRDAAR